MPSHHLMCSFSVSDPDPYEHFRDPGSVSGTPWKLMRIRNTGSYTLNSIHIKDFNILPLRAHLQVYIKLYEVNIYILITYFITEWGHERKNILKIYIYFFFYYKSFKIWKQNIKKRSKHIPYLICNRYVILKLSGHTLWIYPCILHQLPCTVRKLNYCQALWD